MNENQWKKAHDIVNDIEKQYGNRGGNQAEVAEYINQTYSTKLTTNDIAGVTKQLGYCNTVMRQEEKVVAIFLDENFRKHIE
mgnify:CR=1 FL=1